jgi:hypothetical protein
MLFSFVLCESHGYQQSLNDAVPLNAESSLRADHDIETSRVNRFSEAQLGNSFWQYPTGVVFLAFHPFSRTGDEIEDSTGLCN